MASVMHARAAAASGILASIGEPADVRALSLPELQTLAEEMRDQLIHAVSHHGGHLGSNLGAVELTIALHRSFDSPHDVLLWDTGHQAYPHKMLTGRAARFDRLRQEGGLSGYPNRGESHHDLVENSHASTALGYAHGMALAQRHRGERSAIVAVVGDGSLTGGVALESLNNIGHAQLPVIVVVNDNGRSYAPTVSRLCGPAGDAAPFFASLGFRYDGPVDGHDIPSIEAALARARSAAAPIVVHVLTQKGRGYLPAENDPVKCMHDTGPFDPRTGRSPAQRAVSYTDAFAEAILDAAAEDERVFAITAAMPSSTGLSAFADRFPDRFVDVGIAEQAAVTAAAGLAMAGARPVVAVYSTFLNRAWDQVYYDVGLHQLPVVFCVDRAGITGEDGPSHHGVLDLALLTNVPGMTVLAPSSYDDVHPMLNYALGLDTPAAIRWPKGAARAGRAPVPVERARRARSGDDACVLALGRMLDPALEAADRLAQRGVATEVWDIRIAAPLDPAMLAAAGRHDVVVTVEDGVARGGVGARIAARLGELAGTAAQPRVRILGTPAAYLPHGRPDALLTQLGLDAGGIAATVAAIKG